jgi:hypothetical protein
MRFLRYIYLRNLQLPWSCSLPEMRTGEHAGSRSDSNSANTNTSHRLA